MPSENRTDGISRRNVLTTIGTVTVTSGIAVASPEKEQPTLPGAFDHEAVREYARPERALSEVENHANKLLQAMYNDGYISLPRLTRANLQTRSEGILGVSQEGEYGAWFRNDEPKLLVKLPSESREVVLHVHPESGDVFAAVDGEELIKSVSETEDDGVTTESCDICRTYYECTDSLCGDNQYCHCNSCVEAGRKTKQEKFCCCSACGCTDCGYLAEEYCAKECCNACDGDDCIKG